MEGAKEEAWREPQRQKPLLPCSETTELVKETLEQTRCGEVVLHLRGPNMYFVDCWVLMGKMCWTDAAQVKHEQAMSFRVAGVCGPLAAISAEKTQQILRELNDDSATVRIHVHHTTYPYYLFADFEVTPGAGDAWWLSDRLLRDGLARVVSQSERLDDLIRLERDLAAGRDGRAQWREDYNIETPFIIRGRVLSQTSPHDAEILAGDFLKITDWSIEDEVTFFADEPSICRASTHQMRWYQDTFRGVPREKGACVTSPLYVALDAVRCFRSCRVADTRYAVECRDMTSMLCAAADAWVTCEITAMWREIEGEHVVLLEDRAHVRGSIAVDSKNVVAAHFTEGSLAPLAHCPENVKNNFTRYVDEQKKQGLPVSVAVALVIASYDGVHPWAEIRLIDDFMCGTPADFTDCLRWARSAGLERYEPIVLETLPAVDAAPVLHEERSLKWLFGKDVLVGQTLHGVVLSDVVVRTANGEERRKTTLRVRCNLALRERGAVQEEERVVDEDEGVDLETGLDITQEDRKDAEGDGDAIATPTAPADPTAPVDPTAPAEPTAAAATTTDADAHEAHEAPAPPAAPEAPAEETSNTWRHFDIIVYPCGAIPRGDDASRSAVARQAECKVAEVTVIDGRASLVGDVWVVPRWGVPREGGKALASYAPHRSVLALGGDAEAELRRDVPARAALERVRRTCPKVLTHVRQVHPGLDALPLSYYTLFPRCMKPPFLPRYTKEAKKHHFPGYEAMMNVPLPTCPPLTTLIYDSLPLSASIFVGQHMPKPPAVADAGRAGVPVALCAQPQLLQNLLRIILRSLMQAPDKYSAKTSFMIQREEAVADAGAAGTSSPPDVYVVRGKGAASYMRLAPEVRLTYDMAATARPRVRSALAMLGYHTWSVPLCDTDPLDEDALTDPPFYSVCSPRAPETCVFLHPASRLLLKKTTDDDDEAPKATLLVHSLRSLDVTPYWAKEVDFCKVEKLYTAGKLTKRDLARVLGRPEDKKKGPEIPPILRREARQVLSYLLDTLVHRKILRDAGLDHSDIDVGGMLRQYIVNPHNRLMATFIYTIRRLWLETQRVVDSDNSEKPFRKQWDCPSKADDFCDRLVAGAQRIMSDCINFTKENVTGDKVFGYFIIEVASHWPNTGVAQLRVSPYACEADTDVFDLHKHVSMTPWKYSVNWELAVQRVEA